MYLLRIAVRNLFRRRRRTLVTAGVLAFAIIIFLVVESMMAGMTEISYNNIINLESAHLEVGREELYQQDFESPLKKSFYPGEELIAEITALAGYRNHTEVLEFSANITTGRDEFPVRVRAIDPKSFPGVFENDDYLTGGEFLAPDSGGLVIGSQLADVLELKPGDFFTLLFQDKEGSFNTIEGEIQGIVTTPHPDMNLSTVFYDREQAYNALRVEPGAANRIMVRMSDRETAVSAAESLADSLTGTGFSTRSWEDSAQMVKAMQAAGRLENYVVLGLILIVGAIGISNVVILAALERMEEIGMMKAMGLKEGEIVGVFALEATGIGLMGSIIGCFVGFISVALFNRFGFDLGILLGEETTFGIPLIGRIYGGWSPGSFVLVFFFGILVAFLASIIPAFWAARKDPIDAIYKR